MNDLYGFIGRGLIAEAALDKTNRLKPTILSAAIEAEIAAKLSIEQLDEEWVAEARKMAAVYVAIAAFENGLREFVSKRLMESFGENWWVEKVSENIKKKAQSRKDDEHKVRWHTPRGESLIYYTDFPELASIIQQNWPEFEDLLRNLEWAKSLMTTLEKSRNVIMHSGSIETDDIERIGVLIRDWSRQVG